MERRRGLHYKITRQTPYCINIVSSTVQMSQIVISKITRLVNEITTNLISVNQETNT